MVEDKKPRAVLMTEDGYRTMGGWSGPRDEQNNSDKNYVKAINNGWGSEPLPWKDNFKDFPSHDTRTRSKTSGSGETRPLEREKSS